MEISRTKRSRLGVKLSWMAQSVVLVQMRLGKICMFLCCLHKSMHLLQKSSEECTHVCTPQHFISHSWLFEGIEKKTESICSSDLFQSKSWNENVYFDLWWCFVRQLIELHTFFSKEGFVLFQADLGEPLFSFVDFAIVDVFSSEQ